MEIRYGIYIPASIPESYELLSAWGRSSDLLPRVLSSRPDVSKQWLRGDPGYPIGIGRSLQLRASSGFTPDSLLIP